MAGSRIRTRFTGAVGVALAGMALLGVPACSSSASETCTTPSSSCPCPTDAHGGTALVVLTDHASASFTASMKRITATGTNVFDDDRIGLDEKPTVAVVTYDATGSLHEVATFNLEGEGDSATRKEDNAQLQAACLAQAIATLPSEGPGGNLMRALPASTALARRSGPEGAALLVFGLSRSSIETVAMDAVDLSTPDARAHLVTLLRQAGVFGAPENVATTFVDPDEGIANAVTAGHLNQFAEGELCDAVARSFCQRLEVLR